MDVVAVIVAVFLGLPGAWLGYRHFFELPRESRQEVLDRLPDRPGNGVFGPVGEQSFQDKVGEIVKNGMDPSTLRAGFTRPDGHLWKAVRHLYEEKRIDVYLVKEVIGNDDHPDIPEGAPAVLPIFVKGALPPDMRPEQSEIEALLSGLMGRPVGQ